MPNNPIFLQCGCGDDYCAMIEDHKDRHARHCQRWGYDFEAKLYERMPDGEHLWFRIPLILEILKERDPEYLFVADADIMVVDARYDMRDAVPAWAFLGMVMYPLASHVASCHLNCGMTYIRNCEDAIKFFEAVLSRRYERHALHGWSEQSVINDLFYTTDWQKGIALISHRWNNNLHDIDDRAHPIVAAWHGWQHPAMRREIMRAYGATRPLDGESSRALKTGVLAVRD
jgi:hypothetical protein